MERWRSVALAALRYTGQSERWVDDLLTQMAHESGGNPRAINFYMPLDSLILTRRGWLKHDQVVIGDETIGFNPDTGRSEWTRVTAVVHYKDAPIVEFGNNRWSVRCTANHRWINEPKVRDTADLGDDCWLCDWPNFEPPPGPPSVCPECGWVPKRPGGVPLHRARAHGIQGANSRGQRVERFRRRGATTKGGLRVHLGVAHGVRVGHGKFRYDRRMTETADLSLTNHARIRVATDADTGTGLPISDTEAELLGWILGDGHLERPARGRGSIRVTQSKPEGLKALRALVASVGKPCVWYKQAPREEWKSKRTVHIVRFDSDYSADLLARSGYRDPVQMVLGMSASQRHAFLRGVIHAEGTVQSTGGQRGGQLTVIPQRYGAKHEAIKVAVFLCGFRPSVSDRTEYNREHGWEPAGVIGTVRPFITPNFRVDVGVTDVWCVTTELGTWTAEQNGHIFLTGNSDINAQRGDPSRGSSVAACACSTVS